MPDRTSPRCRPAPRATATTSYSKANVVGPVNRGWDVAKYLLQHERAMISGMGERGVGRPLGQVAADSVGTDEQGRLEAPMLRGQIASFEIDEAALAAAAERAV